MAGAGTPYLLGYNKEVFIEREATYGTDPVVVSADYLPVKSITINPRTDRRNRTNARPTRGIRNRHTGLKTVEWSLTCDFTPAASAGGLDDTALGDLFLGTFGAHAGSSDDTYTFSSSQTALGSFTMLVNWDALHSHLLTGCVVQTCKISVDGPNEVALEFSGFAKSHVHTSYVLSAAATVSTTITVDNLGKYALEIGSLVEIDSTKYTVTAGPSANGSDWDFTVDGSPNVSDNEAIVPWAPAVSVSGFSDVPLVGVNGGLTLNVQDGVGAVSMPFRAFEITVDTGAVPADWRSGVTEVPDYVVKDRLLTGKVVIDARRDVLYTLAARKSFPACDIVATLGDSGGRYATVTCSQAELEFEAHSDSESDEVTIGLPFAALESTTGDDEISFAIF